VLTVRSESVTIRRRRRISGCLPPRTSARRRSRSCGSFYPTLNPVKLRNAIEKHLDQTLGYAHHQGQTRVRFLHESTNAQSKISYVSHHGGKTSVWKSYRHKTLTSSGLSYMLSALRFSLMPCSAAKDSHCAELRCRPTNRPGDGIAWREWDEEDVPSGHDLDGRFCWMSAPSGAIGVMSWIRRRTLIHPSPS